MASGGQEPMGTNGEAGGESGWSAVPPVEELVRFWDLALVPMGVGDYDGNYLHLNRAYHDLLGWSVEELKSVPWWEFLHPDDRDDMADVAQQLMDHGRVRFGDNVRMLCRNGCYRWVRWNTAADPDRRLFYSVGVALGPASDSGERVDVGTWEWRPSTQTVTCSRELVALLAVTTGPTMTSRSVLGRVHPDDRARVQLRALDSRITGERFAEDFRLRRADGTIRWLHAAARADRNPDGHIHRLHGIAVDVTERINQA